MTSVDDIAALLGAARSALFVTGAGISADSGLPTYRGIGGLYASGLTEDGVPYEEALSGAMLRRDPARCWRTLAEVERACRGARPNRAHQVVAAFESRMERVVVLTQNVDGFHLDAGSTDVIEAHGTLRRLRCTRCPWTRDDPDHATLDALPPRCPACGAVARPDVVLFGEMLPEAVQRRLARLSAAAFDAVVVVGTTAVFPYIQWPVVEARRAGVPTVEINPGRSEVSHLATHRLPLGAAEALDAVWARLPRRGTTHRC